MMMFDPAGVTKKKAEAAAVRAACARVRGMVLAIMPESMRGEGAEANPEVKVREVQCGDPECAPIDTSVEFWFGDDGHPQGFGLAMEAREGSGNPRRSIPSLA